MSICVRITGTDIPHTGLDEIKIDSAPIVLEECTIHRVLISPNTPKEPSSSIEDVFPYDEAEKEQSDDEADEEECRLAHSHGRSPSVAPAATTPAPSDGDDSNTQAPFRGTVAYVGLMAAPVGKFDPARAKALGVSPGKDFGKLQKGESVTVASGATVHPEQVLGPAPPGQVFVVLDCPTVDIVLAVLHSNVFDLCSSNGRAANVVFHITVPEVADSPEYRTLVDRFGSKAAHVFLHEDYVPAEHNFVAASQNHVCWFQKLKYHISCLFTYLPDSVGITGNH